MDNIELQKQRSEANDQQLQQTEAPLQESAQIVPTSVPRVNFLSHFMHTWQPMGIRVIVKLPYISDDANPMFYIRTGPHIPDFVNLTQDDPWIYWMANQFPVIIGGESETYEANPAVTVSQFDAPPPLAAMARMFRRWRGRMDYRIRTVANFTQQAYIIAFPVKNVFRPPNVHNPWTERTPIIPKDTSFKEGMLNSYIMSDVSFQRHIEISVPYEFPNQYYDQTIWCANRTYPLPATNIVEPHGDNYIAIATRGGISTESTGQLSFELEYRAGEDFQFGDPFLAGSKFRYPIRNWRSILNNPTPTFTFPDSTITSDGIATRSKTS